ncbi:MAG: right-handed parallel beta-helix repeat-containing protein [Anaerolineaceae bacterium]
MSATTAGGIENYGTLNISDCSFTDTVSSATYGGAIYNQSGSVTITNGAFSDNTVVDGTRGGGAIFSLAGSLNIDDSSFSGNSAPNGGGVYCYDCLLNIDDSTFTGNNVPDGSGGGIYSYSGNVNITDSTFAGNGAPWSVEDGGGGAIFSDYDSLTIINSIFDSNTATGSSGGAILSSSLMDIRLSTFTNNSADSGGAIFNSGEDSTIANSTFSDNSASAAGISGGAVVNSDELTISNSTIYGNSAIGSGGGIGNISGTLRLRNTIVANNTADNCGGIIANGGSNLDSGSTCGWGSESGSMSNINPLLSALEGSPAYFPLDPGSPAIDLGNDAICAAAPVNNQSQNNITRPLGTHCDMGSYETQDTTPPVVQGITRSDPNPVTATKVHFTVHFSEAVTGVDLSDFVLAVSGLTGSSISSVSGNASTYQVTVKVGWGTGTVRLDLVDDDSIVDQGLLPLGGVGYGNGDFDVGETYDVQRYPYFLPQVLK